jgi:glucose-6-phosphate isomerase
MFIHMSTTPIIRAAPLTTDWSSGHVSGAAVQRAERRLGDLRGLFADEAARAALPQERLAYATECAFPVPEGSAGGLFWGTTFIEPGLVGDEYFMTKGHFHAQADRSEFYFTFAGEGLLLLMDATRRCWAERMLPGSVHPIPPRVAHRTVNIGQTRLSFGACWPADAGHDYEAIAREGFACRVRQIAGCAQVVAA